MLQFDLALAPPIVDLLLGGDGREGALRELTDIEEAILGSVVEIICRELTVAWQPVCLSFNFERRQMQTQVARVISVNEKTLCLSFEIRMPHSSGLLNLAFPAVVANTILRRLTSDWGRRRRHAPEIRARLEASARHINFGATLQLPAVRLPASSVENLAPGDVLRLDVPANAVPEWRVGGQLFSRAEAIRQGAHRAARLKSTCGRRDRKPAGGHAEDELPRLLDASSFCSAVAGPGRRTRTGGVIPARRWKRAPSVCRRDRRGSHGALFRSRSISPSSIRPCLGKAPNRSPTGASCCGRSSSAACGELLAKTGTDCRVARFEPAESGSQVTRAFQLRSSDRVWTILVKDDVRVPEPAAASRRRRTHRFPQLPRGKAKAPGGGSLEPRDRVADGRGTGSNAAVRVPGNAAGRNSGTRPRGRGAAGPACFRSGGPDCGRQDRGARRRGAGEREFRAAGDRGGGAAQAAGEHTMPVLSSDKRGLKTRPETRAGRSGILESCANRGCASGWLHLWRSRSAPVFEEGWTCSPACTEERLRAAVRRELDGRSAPASAYRHRLPLGLLMMEKGWITSAQLRRALEAQKAAGGGRLGQYLVRQQAASEQLVTRALSLQWSCPVLSAAFQDPETLAPLMPRLFIDAFGAVPLRMAAGKILYVGFEERLDAVLALALERMSGLRVESGLVHSSEFGPAQGAHAGRRLSSRATARSRFGSGADEGPGAGGGTRPSGGITPGPRA